MEEKEVISEQMLDSHIASAFTFARKNHCEFKQASVKDIFKSYPPLEDGTANGFSLIARAMYTLGCLQKGDESLIDVLENAGLWRSDDPFDIFKRHGIVLLRRSDAPEDSPRIDYAFYSLGGDDYESITKYDIGMPVRLKTHRQPYKGVAADEWCGKLSFVCMYFAPKSLSDKRLLGPFLRKGTAKKTLYMRNCIGRNEEIVHSVRKGSTGIKIYAVVTTSLKNSWCYVEHRGFYGWVYRDNIKYKKLHISPQFFRAASPARRLERRMGAGRQFAEFDKLPPAYNGEKFRIINILRDDDGEKWANVKDKRGLCYFVQRKYLKEMGEI